MSLKKFIAPALPLAPENYSRAHLDELNRILNLYFKQLDSNGGIQVDNLSFSVSNATVTLPTEADLATLRVGDVYRDTTADNALKVKI